MWRIKRKFENEAAIYIYILSVLCVFIYSKIGTAFYKNMSSSRSDVSQVRFGCETATLEESTLQVSWLLSDCVEETAPFLTLNPPFKMFGKECCQRRSVGFFSDVATGYTYSGQTSKANPVGIFLYLLMGTINTMFGTDYNSVLVNRYETGEDYIGAHSDDEKALDPAMGVISVSWGARRIFRIRDKKTKKPLFEMGTNENQILIMRGNFQQLYTHEIPKAKRIHAPRVSFTFRKHLL